MLSAAPMNNSSQNSPSEPQQPARDPEAHLQQVCAIAYGEPIQIVFWRLRDTQGNLEIVFREHRRGWYFQMLLLREDQQYKSEYQALPTFTLLLGDDVKYWEKLTEQATAEDWLAIDKIMLYALTIPGSKIFFADERIIGKKVVEAAIERFGCCIPEASLLPVFIFENATLGLNLISYFKDPDRFAGENLIQDHHLDQCEACDSLYLAQTRLKQKLDYYLQKT